ncbi:MAG: hypothetical protein HC865_08955 [Cyanobacteria bacterium RU_5_0]|nr:hypothetical protein [Cyanobacteria bacterium RU_5_0]
MTRTTQVSDRELLKLQKILLILAVIFPISTLIIVPIQPVLAQSQPQQPEATPDAVPTPDAVTPSTPDPTPDAEATPDAVTPPTPDPVTPSTPPRSSTPPQRPEPVRALW